MAGGGMQPGREKLSGGGARAPPGPEPPMAAGAEGNVNYTNEMILRRAALRTDKSVLAALDFAWGACSGMDVS